MDINSHKTENRHKSELPYKIIAYNTRDSLVYNYVFYNYDKLAETCPHVLVGGSWY